MVSGLENQHFIKGLSIFSPSSKYEPALQVKTDHARFVHLSLSVSMTKVIFLNEPVISADFDSDIFLLTTKGKKNRNKNAPKL